MEDALSIPCFKEKSNGFVVKRSDYSQQQAFSPLPDAFSDFADEDTWMKMNRGYIADLDSLQITSARKVQSFSPIVSTDVSFILLYILQLHFFLGLWAWLSTSTSLVYISILHAY